MLLYYCTDVNKSSLFQRWCTGGTCGGARSAVCEAISASSASLSSALASSSAS